jgi:hypothetical protein
MGLSLAKKLKLGFPGVSVVAISGHSSDEHRKRAPHAGFDGLRYPVELTTGATYRLGRIFDGIDVSPPSTVGIVLTGYRQISGCANSKMEAAIGSSQPPTPPLAVRARARLTLQNLLDNGKIERLRKVAVEARFGRLTATLFLGSPRDGVETRSREVSL